MNPGRAFLLTVAVVLVLIAIAEFLATVVYASQPAPLPGTSLHYKVYALNISADCIVSPDKAERLSAYGVNIQENPTHACVLSEEPAQADTAGGNAPAQNAGTDAAPQCNAEMPCAIEVVLRLAGWPEWLIGQAIAVVNCETGGTFDPYSYNAGGYYGWFQLSPLWFGYCGWPLDLWYDAVVNSAVAYCTYNYDIGRGQAPWSQWECKP